MTWFSRLVRHLARKRSVSILTTWSPHGARLQDKGQLNFHTPFVLNAPSEGFPFEFCNGGGAQ